MTDVVQKLWGFCHVLRHDGMDYGDYIEQLTYLLFLKMADEYLAFLNNKTAKIIDLFKKTILENEINEVVKLETSNFHNSML